MSTRTRMLTTLGAATLALATQAHAGWSIGKITYMNVNNVGSRPVARAVIEEDIHSPACGNKGFILHIDTPQGRAQYAMLLSAWTSGKVAGIAGTNACSIEAGVEDVSHVELR